MGVREPMELDCTDSMPTYPHTGHLSCHRHSLGVFIAPYDNIINYFSFIFIILWSNHFFGQFKKSSLGRLFMDLIHKVNVCLKPWFLAHVKRTY